MKKILIISDMHSGITRESKTRPGYTRQPSSQALKTLEAYRDKWHTDSFEHLIELGDMTKPIPESHDNVQLYRDAVNTIKSLGLPTTFVFGNHDIEYLSKAEIKEITDQSSFNSVTQIGGFQIVTFEHSQLDKDTAQILRETMDWFEENVKKDIQTILFSHYSLKPVKMDGSFGFEGKDSTVQIQNSEEFVNFLGKFDIRASINGHLHWAGYSKMRMFPCVTVLPFTDNILSSCDIAINPGIYHVLELDGNELRLKSYSGDFCFLNIEI